MAQLNFVPHSKLMPTVAHDEIQTDDGDDDGRGNYYIPFPPNHEEKAKVEIYIPPPPLHCGPAHPHAHPAPHSLQVLGNALHAVHVHCVVFYAAGQQLVHHRLVRPLRQQRRERVLPTV